MHSFRFLRILYRLQVYVLTKSSHGLDKLNFSHSEDSLALHFVNLCHHRTIEVYEAVSFDDGAQTKDAHSLTDILELVKTHEGFLSWFDFHLGILLVDLLEDWPQVLDECVILFSVICIVPPFVGLVSRKYRLQVVFYQIGHTLRKCLENAIFTVFFIGQPDQRLHELKPCKASFRHQAVSSPIST